MNMYENEEWRDIEGFVGYQVSNLGRVRSARLHKVGQIHGCDRVGNTYRIMSTKSDDGSGYLKVMLRRNGKSYCRKIHRLVAEAFVPNPEGLNSVNHISNNKRDNRAVNLEWMEHGENVSKAYKDGLHSHDIERRRIPYLAVDTFSDNEYYFSSREELADFLDLDSSTISHEMAGGKMARIRGYDVYKLRERSE
jgi:hypothetical protein